MIFHPAGGFDNQASDYKYIKATPLAAAMGAEISGAHLSNVSDEEFAEIRHALFRHKMIYFRNQDISHAEQETFSRKFGAFAEDAYTKGVEGHRNIQPVIKEADVKVGMIFGSGWHTDSPFLPEPPAISMLLGVDIPPFGGDTMWANSALAYALLSDTMKTVLAPLKVHMSMRNVLAHAQKEDIGDSPIGKLAATRNIATLPEDLQRKVTGSMHPLVRTHPVSGEKSIYCDKTYAVNIEGMREDEAKPILDYLMNHITQPALTCRLRWAAHTFVIWDNRLCVHQAFNDHDGFRREMYRTTIAGEVPA
jgi:alpha-ketoglutarate-dependent taurine dioxygenase